MAEAADSPIRTLVHVSSVSAEGRGLAGPSSVVLLPRGRSGMSASVLCRAKLGDCEAKSRRACLWDTSQACGAFRKANSSHPFHYDRPL
ncbi:protein of unknown function [Streptomyces sp. KY75]|nr:protein of unknown function [Streptomyces sp. KY75]CAD5995035.1 protein of unknown function [Streptomyces sp. KY70]